MSQLPGVCHSCGDDFVRVNSKRIYCACCQSIRDIQYRPDMSKKCDLCQEVFWPIKSNYRTCPACQVEMRPEKYDPCVNCNEQRRPAPGLSAWCISCVQQSKNRRDSYLRHLLNRRKELVAQRDVPAMVREREAERLRREDVGPLV